MSPRILISGCLAGLRVRYNGVALPHPWLEDLTKRAVLFPCCPEILGGLGVPRSPCRFVGGDGRAVLKGQARVFDNQGIDRTGAFLRGAEEVLHQCRLVQPDLIIFKERGQSCGLHSVDIEGRKQLGCGVATAVLEFLGIPIIAEEDPLPAASEPVGK